MARGGSPELVKLKRALKASDIAVDSGLFIAFSAAVNTATVVARCASQIEAAGRAGNADVGAMVGELEAALAQLRKVVDAVPAGGE